MFPSPSAIQRLGRPHEPLLIMLIGPPGAGKTTWRQDYIRQCRSPVPHVVSTDDIIEQEAERANRLYADVMKEMDMASITDAAMGAYVKIMAHGCDVIIDRTNLTVSSRWRWLSLCPPRYVRVAVVFDPDPYVLADRLISRETQTGKSIPVEVLTNMLVSYEPPEATEFHHVLRAED